jgi:cardiolipin synthase
VVVDEYYALVGGLNISDHYSGYHGQTPWLDYAVLIMGNVCMKLSRIAMSLFNRKYMPVSVMNMNKQLGNPVHVRFRQSDYIRGKKEITNSYKEFIQSAREEIIIVNAYYLPGFRMRRMLQKAIKRGVKINLILSADSDIPLVKRATNYYYSWLFRNKIKVYEYLPSVVHAKLAVFDRSTVTLGSFNLNYLSEYVSVELNVDVKDKHFASALSSELLTLQEKSCRLAEHHFTTYSNILSRFLDFISYQTVMYAMRFLYLITRKDRLNIFK